MVLRSGVKAAADAQIVYRSKTSTSLLELLHTVIRKQHVDNYLKIWTFWLKKIGKQNPDIFIKSTPGTKKFFNILSKPKIV